MQQENNPTQVELSEIWLELLGQASPVQALELASTDEECIPTLESDPWSHLLQVQGTTTVDLQKVSLRMDDCDVEQLLQQLQERNEL